MTKVRNLKFEKENENKTKVKYKITKKYFFHSYFVKHQWNVLNVIVKRFITKLIQLTKKKTRRLLLYEK